MKVRILVTTVKDFIRVAACKNLGGGLPSSLAPVRAQHVLRRCPSERVRRCWRPIAAITGQQVETEAAPGDAVLPFQVDVPGEASVETIIAIGGGGTCMLPS